MTETSISVNLAYSENNVIYLAGKQSFSNDECMVVKLLKLDDHVGVTNSTNLMKQMTSSDYIIESLSMTGTEATFVLDSGGSVTNTTSFTTEINYTASYFTDVAYYLQGYRNYSMPERIDLNLGLNFTWSINGSTEITNSLEPWNNESSVPDWVQINSDETGLVMRTPNVVSGKFFNFTVLTSVDSSNYTKDIIIKIVPEDQTTIFVERLIYWTLFLNFIYMLITMILTSKKMASKNSIFSLCSQFQMLCWTIWIGELFSNDIGGYVKGLNYFMFSFGFYFTEDELLNREIDFEAYFGWENTNNQLFDISIESCSTLINILPIFTMILSIIFLHHFWYFTYKLFQGWDGKNFPNGFFSKASIKVKRIFFWDPYIIILFQSMLFVTLSSFHEISKLRFETKWSIISFVISVLSLIFGIWFWIYVYLLNSKRKVALFWHRKRWTPGYVGFGFKLREVSRHFHLFYLIRRFLLALTVIFIPSIVYVRLFLFFIWNLTQVAYLLIWKPFLRMKENIIEIINEFVLLTFLLILTYFNEKKKWNKYLSYSLLFLFVTNALILIIIQVWTCKVRKYLSILVI